MCRTKSRTLTPSALTIFTLEVSEHSLFPAQSLCWSCGAYRLARPATPELGRPSFGIDEPSRRTLPGDMAAARP